MEHDPGSNEPRLSQKDPSHRPFEETTTGSVAPPSASTSPATGAKAPPPAGVDGSSSAGGATISSIAPPVTVIEASFRTLAEQSPNMIFINCRGKVIYANSLCSMMMGYTREEFSSPDFDFMCLIAPESQALIRTAWSRHLQDENVEPYEYVLLTKNGRRIDAIITTKAIALGNDSAILGIITDITERKLAELALKESEQRLSLHFEQTPVGVVEWDLDFRAIKWNSAARRIFGYSREEILGCHASRILPESARARVDEVWNNLLAQRGGRRSINENVTRDGKIILCDWYNTPLVDPDGNVIAVASIVQDITHEKRLEEEIQKGQKLESLGLLAGGIAHDFNNILTAILGNISLARISIEQGEDCFAWLEQAEQAIARASSMTRQLLTFAKGGTSVRKVLSLENLIREATGFALSGANVQVEYAIEPQLWAVEADEGQIIQVFNNLALNAVQAMPMGGTITVGACNMTESFTDGVPLPAGQYVRVTVTDRGVGIAREHLPKIFDPYFTTKDKGSGLGLTVSYSIVKNHDGLITVESEPGKGTTLTTYLPATRKTPAEVKAPARQLLTGRGRILLMDDEEMVRTVGDAILSRLGYEVVTAPDGHQAIHAYRDAKTRGCPFDVVIMDLTVPGGLGGKETVKELRRLDPDVKAIVSSGYSSDPIVAHFREYGFSAVLSKPYRISELGEVLQGLLDTQPPSS